MFCHATTCQNIVNWSAYFIQTVSFFHTVTVTVSVLLFLFSISVYYCNYFDSIAEKIRSIKKNKFGFSGNGKVNESGKSNLIVIWMWDYLEFRCVSQRKSILVQMNRKHQRDVRNANKIQKIHSYKCQNHWICVQINSINIDAFHLESIFLLQCITRISIIRIKKRKFVSIWHGKCGVRLWVSELDIELNDVEIKLIIAFFLE